MNRENALIVILVTIAAAVIAWQVAGLVELYLADCPPGPAAPADDGPGAAEVSALIEEAKRITGESR